MRETFSRHADHAPGKATFAKRMEIFAFETKTASLSGAEPSEAKGCQVPDSAQLLLPKFSGQPLFSPKSKKFFLFGLY